MPPPDPYTTKLTQTFQVKKRCMAPFIQIKKNVQLLIECEVQFQGDELLATRKSNNYIDMYNDITLVYRFNLSFSSANYLGSTSNHKKP